MTVPHTHRLFENHKQSLCDLPVYLQVVMVGPEQDRPFALLQTQRFVERLKQFGYEDDPEFVAAD